MSYMSIAKILPKRVRVGYNKLLVYSGVRVAGERFLGFSFIFGLALAATISYVLFVLMGIGMTMALIAFGLTYGIFEGGVYMRLWMRSDSRRSFVEGILPDALQIMAMNIRAGMTTDRAIILTARPEFGVFEEELKRAGKKMMSGASTRDAMLGITERIKSRQLETTIKLIIDGIESGGELASLLEQTASDIQNTKLMEKEVKANVLMYVIFIFFAVGIGAPLIFGISTHLVDVLTEQMSHFDTVKMPDYESTQVKGIVPMGSFSGFGISAVSIDPDFLVLYAIMSLLMTSFFGGLTLGVIKEGSEKNGVKYVPLLMAMSMGIFFATRILAEVMFAI